jgi:AbrB family looped-hinge helix DNA binding protein
MSQIVSITSQGQVTIPKAMRTFFGISSATKAVISKVGSTIVIQPKPDFWSLEGSLNSAVKLSDDQLRAARSAFEKKWSSK